MTGRRTHASRRRTTPWRPGALCLATALAFAATLLPGRGAGAAEMVDVLAYFDGVAADDGAGLARKTKPVDARPAVPGEVVITVILGEGRETESPPAAAGDMVVRNRCPETGNEEILVTAAKFAERYDGPLGAAGADGYRPYRPRGIEMRFVIVHEADGTFRFVAPWGEAMVARPGDAIVQDPGNPADTYRIARAAFACTYEITAAPAPG
jgi:hypothetical protein